MPARYETIAREANLRNWEKGVEVGVFDGQTFKHLVAHCPKLFLIGVDVWDHKFELHVEGKSSGERCSCPHCSRTRASRKAMTITQMREDVQAFAAQHLERCSLRVNTSLRESTGFGLGELDFVFIDGDHSTEGVKADIRAWRSKVRSGGILFGHDWNMASVRDAVLSAFSPSEVKHEYDDHLWSVRL